jgi:hypothetical protein
MNKKKKRGVHAHGPEKKKKKSGPVGYIFNLKKIKVLFYLTYHLASGLVGYIFNLKKNKSFVLFDLSFGCFFYFLIFIFNY